MNIVLHNTVQTCPKIKKMLESIGIGVYAIIKCIFIPSNKLL